MNIYEKHSVYSYESVRELSFIYFKEILERKDLEYILDSRKVRFINPLGEFDYTSFGNFYFSERGVMMLITTKKEYVPYHKTDKLSDTFLSTVPVIFAGVETRIKDDCGKEIYTNDVVTYDLYTSLVAYHGTSFGIKGDNGYILFDVDKGIHKEGTAYTYVPIDMYSCYDSNFVNWAMGGFYFGGSFQDVKTNALCSMKNPRFINDEKICNRKEIKRIYKSIDEVLKGDETIVCFKSETITTFFDDMDGKLEDLYEIFEDNYPEGYDEICTITYIEEDEREREMKSNIEDFLHYAHENSSKHFVLCDFVESLGLSKFERDRIAKMFNSWYEFNIHNVSLPYWIYIALLSNDCIGHY